MSDNQPGPHTTSTLLNDFQKTGDNAALVGFVNCHPETRPQESQGSDSSSENILDWTATGGVWDGVETLGSTIGVAFYRTI